MTKRTTFFLVLAATMLSGSTAWACISAMYREVVTTPLDFLPLGVIFASFSIARLHKKELSPTRDAQLKRLGIGLLGSFMFGLFAATSYGADVGPGFVFGFAGACAVLAGILFRGWKWVRKAFVLLGFMSGLLGGWALMIDTTFGEPAPEKFEKFEKVVHADVQF